jgi:hypothetical protein
VVLVAVAASLGLMLGMNDWYNVPQKSRNPKLKLNASLCDGKISTFLAQCQNWTPVTPSQWFDAVSSYLLLFSQLIV